MATTEQVEEFLQQFVDWAANQADILAVALVGSYARGQARQTSDVDLVMIAADPARLLQRPAWVERFGRVRQVQIEDYGKVTSVRAWYRDGLEVEFGLTNREWVRQPLDPGTRRVIEQGLRVVYEQENILSKLI